MNKVEETCAKLKSIVERDSSSRRIVEIPAPPLTYQIVVRLSRCNAIIRFLNAFNLSRTRREGVAGSGALNEVSSYWRGTVKCSLKTRFISVRLRDGTVTVIFAV